MIHYTESPSGIGRITIDRPDTRNALNWQHQRDFADLVEQCHASETLKVLIITGSDDIFVAGGDIKDQVGHYESEDGKRLRAIMGSALERLTQLPHPVIAAINGNAYGGGSELITACDIRIMSAEAKLYFVQARMGLTSGWGGTARLVHLVGASHAMEILLTTRGIDAEKAVRIGLAHEIVSAEASVLDAAIDYANRLLRLPSSSLGALKLLVWQSTTIEAGYSAEDTLFVQQYAHPHHIEAVNAFIEKRKPNFD